MDSYSTANVYGWMDGVAYDCSVVNNTATNLSQALAAWTYQPTYATNTVYFIVVTIFLAILARVYCIAIDLGRKQRFVKHQIDSPQLVAANGTSEKRDGGELAATAPDTGERQNDVHPLRHVFAMCRFVGYRRAPVWIQKVFGASPSAAMNLIVAALFLYMCLWCFIPRFWYRACAYMGSPPLAIRAGLLATALVPFIYATVGKVNVLSGITGISYERINFLHRSMGWIALFFSWVHTIPFLYQAVREQSLRATWAAGGSLWVSGVVWLVFFSWLCILSLRSVRVAMYELWLIMHWPIGLATLGMAFWHSEGNLFSWNYLYAAVAILLSGYCYRFLIKTNYLNLFAVRWYVSDQAHVRELPGTGCVEISIFSSVIRRWSPGQHFYLRFPSVEPFANHPFSVGTLCDSRPATSLETAVDCPCDPNLSSNTDRNSATSGESTKNVTVSNNNRDCDLPLMKFVVRRHEGFTKRLYTVASKQTAENAPLSVMIEGPYGGISRSVDAFDEVILCCTGNGATATVPFMLDLAPRIGATTVVRKVRLLWVVRELAHLQLYDDELARLVETVPQGRVEIHIYVVSRPADGSANKFRVMKMSGKNCHVHFEGRPNVPKALREWSRDYSPRSLFVCCGSPSFSVDIGNTVAGLQPNILFGRKNSAGETYREFYLHSEMFGW